MAVMVAIPPAAIVIAGPTASGKSALALALARALGGPVVNADALQVYDAWSVLSARPGPEDTEVAPHLLYGHVPATVRHSVGDWLREVAPLLDGAEVPVIVGGTGLYLSALTRGLAEIPPVPEAVRAEGDALRAEGVEALRACVARRDPVLFARMDRDNPMRLQRAWEVHRATGRPLSAWQDETPPPLLPLERCVPLVLEAPVDWLDARIAARLRRMAETGALDEVRAARAWWDPALPASKALGAAELLAHLEGRMGLDEALAAATLATRRFAKRQRTWFRSNMGAWRRIDASAMDVEAVVSAVLSAR